MVPLMVPHLSQKDLLQFFTGTEMKKAKRKLKTKVNKEIQVRGISQSLFNNVAKDQGRRWPVPQLWGTIYAT